MEFSREIKMFIEDYTKCIKEDCAAIFAGAGLSVESGYVNWNELLRIPARRIGLDVDQEKDLVTLTQYICNEDGSKQRIAEHIKNKFASCVQINEKHRILARLPIKTYWTTNYDSLIEDALKECGKRPDVKKTVNDLSTILSKRDAVVYKMHGDINNPCDVVIAKEDYEMYDLKNKLFRINLQGDLISKTFLFIGFSFEDPNLEYVLSKIKILSGGFLRRHYCFFKKVDNSEYDKLKQKLKCEDLLKRYNIQALMVNDYSEITEILKEIEKTYKKDHVFISGSADEFKEFKIQDIDAYDFVHKLSKEINKLGCKIITGNGKGIGSAVLNGVLESMYSTDVNNNVRIKNLDEYIIMRPFPLYSTNGIDLKNVHKKYREDMINLAGIAVFVLGNKTKDNKEVENSPGVIEEFELAVEKGLHVIPIGATGYASKELWNRVMKNFEKYYPHKQNLKEDFELLGKSGATADKIIKTVCKIISQLTETY